MHVNIKYVVMDGVNWIAQLPSHTLFLFEVWGDFLCLETQEQSGIIGVHNHSSQCSFLAKTVVKVFTVVLLKKKYLAQKKKNRSPATFFHNDDGDFTTTDVFRNVLFFIVIAMS